MSGLPPAGDSPAPAGTLAARRRRPSVQLVAATVAIVALIAAGGTVAAWANASGERDRVTDEAALQAQAAGGATDEFVRSQIRLLEVLGATPALRSADPARISAALNDLPHLDATLTAVAWIDLDGTVQARTPPQFTERINVADREHVRAVLATGRPFVSSALIPRNPVVGGPSVVIAVPVFDSAGRMNGMLGNTITLEILSAVLAPFGDAGSAMIVVDRSGRVLVDTSAGRLNQDVSTAPLLAEARQAPSGVRIDATNFSGHRGRLVAWWAVPSAEWLLLSDRSAGAAFGPARRTFLNVAALLLAASVGAVLLSLLVGRRLDRHEAERLRAAQALRSSRDQLDAVLHSVDAAITARDQDGRYVFANAAASRLLGIGDPGRVDQLALDTVPAAVELYDAGGVPLPPEASPYARARRGEQVPEMLLRWRAGSRGRHRWIRTRSTPVLDAAGRTALVVSVTTDVTDERRQEAAQQLLADAGNALSGDLDVEQRLEALVRRIVPGTADYCAVHLRDVNGSVRRVVAAHVDPEVEDELARRYPAVLPANGTGPVSRVMQSGRGMFVDGDREQIAPTSTTPASLRPYLELLAPESVIAAPLVARGSTLGVLVLMMAGSGRRFAAAEVPLVEELGRRAGIAVDNARLYADAREAEEAARRHAGRLAILASASRAFAEARLEGPRMAQTVARTVISATGDGCIVRLVGHNGMLGPAAIAHPAPEAEAAVRDALATLGDDRPLLLPDGVAAGGQRVLLPVGGAALAEQVAPVFWEYIERFGTTCLLSLPLRVHGRVIGAMTLARDYARPRYTDEEAEFLQDLADRAAVALDNARLHDAERLARERAEAAAGRIALLQSITGALAEALTADDVAAVALARGQEALGAAAGAVLLLTPAGNALELRYRDGEPSAIGIAGPAVAVTRPLPVAEAVRETRAIWLADVAQHESIYPDMAELTRRGEIRGHAAIPLVVEGRCIGVLSFSFTDERTFTAEEQDLGAALARQCAQALERARRYESERAARAEAETANRAKDEFLSTLSHELRTPLTSMLGWARLLRSRRLDPATTDEGLATIERATRTQARLIEELLDVSRIVSGKLSLDLQPVELLPITRSAVEAIRPAADLKGITLTASLDPESGRLQADAERLQQVFGNLLSNAVKFTPAGGRIAVRLHRQGETAVVTVEDSGAGFTADFAPHMFERFRQADASSTREHGGLGLGLAIAKSLVDLHGGSIRADSPGPGRGATFEVMLPLLRQEAAGVGDAEPAPDPPQSADESPLRGVRILWVEDDPDVRGFVAAVLTDAGAVVRSCGSGEEALALAAREQPEVLVSDIGLPRLDGHDLLKRLRQPGLLPAGAPALALTAYAGAADERQARAAGYDAFLAKPVEPVHLVEMLAGLIGRASPA